jgi:hypothetical protein
MGSDEDITATSYPDALGLKSAGGPAEFNGADRVTARHGATAINRRWRNRAGQSLRRRLRINVARPIPGGYDKCA